MIEPLQFRETAASGLKSRQTRTLQTVWRTVLLVIAKIAPLMIVDHISKNFCIAQRCAFQRDETVAM
jgi:hypothetical protein